jgi:hypothetical protein
VRRVRRPALCASGNASARERTNQADAKPRRHAAWSASFIFKTVRAMDGAAGAPMDGFMAFPAEAFAERVRGLNDCGS